MKKILVPTDFSEQAENALKVAVQIAKKQDAELYILHTLNIPLHLANTSDGGGLPESVFFMKLTEKRFSDLMNKPYLQDVAVNEIVGHNEVYEDIMEASNKNDVDLIVMGSHGASGFKEMFIGSNAEKVVRTCKKPVLIIKNNLSDFNPKSFVFATDFEEDGQAAFNKAQKFAQNLGAKMNLLYVNTPGNFNTSSQINERMKKFVRGLGEEDYKLTIYNDFTVEKGILQYAQDINADLIGMGTHGRKGISHFFNGSISEDLVNHANMPIVTFKI